MIVTINTDASFSKKHERGTYAFWIICNEFKVTMSGIIKKRCVRPEIAEYRAIINALHVLLTAQTNKKITRIIINTDCLNVIHLFNRDKEKIMRYNLASWGNHLTLMAETMLRQYGIKKESVDIRHVKSHENTDTPRNFVNQWV